MDARTWRITFVALTVALALLLALAVILYSSGGEDTLPDPLRSVSPLPGAIAVAPAELVVEIAIGYDVALVVDGVPIPAEEVVAIPATGTFRWRPGEGSVIATWEAGTHRVEVSWDRSAGRRPDPGSFSWSFRLT